MYVNFSAFTMDHSNSCLVCASTGGKGFFTIPMKNEAHRKTWVELTRLGDYFLTNPKPHHRICWRHFNYDDINYGGKYVTVKTGKLKFVDLEFMVTMKHK